MSISMCTECEEPIANLFLLLVLSMVIGARAFYVVTNLSDFADRPLDAIMIQKGGMVFYGSFIAILASLIWFCRRHKMPFFRVGDVLVIGASLGLALVPASRFVVLNSIGKPGRPGGRVAAQGRANWRPGCPRAVGHRF